MDSPNLSQLLHIAGAYITHTFPDGIHADMSATVRVDSIDIQILRGMDPRDRADTLTGIAGTSIVHVERYTFDGATYWGDASLSLTFRGVPVRIWTSLSDADAEILGLAVTA